MRIAVLQPSYLPWLGYLDQIASVDAFVFYDDVQYDKNGWRNRNRIRVQSETGWSWLTVPVRLESHFPPLADVTVDERVPWRRKHHTAIASAYGKASHFDLFERYFGSFYNQDSSNNLADIAISNVRCFMNAFQLVTPTYRSSELGIEGDKNSRLLNFCRHFGASTYVSGLAARDYLNVALFEAAGIRVEWQQYEHPVYRQRYEPFISHLSALDALLTVGSEASNFIGGPHHD